MHMRISLLAALMVVASACGGAKKAKLADSPGGTLGGFAGSASNQAPSQCADGTQDTPLTNEELNACGTCVGKTTGPLADAFKTCVEIGKGQCTAGGNNDNCACKGLFTPDTAAGESTPDSNASCCSLLLDCFSNIYRTTGGVAPTPEEVAARAQSCRTRAGSPTLLDAFTHVYKQTQTECGTQCRIPETQVASAGCPANARKNDNASCDGCRCLYGFNSNGTDCISTFCGAGKQPVQDTSKTPPQWSCGAK